ncbi:hypothetical protein BGZ70_001137 [Mortierella alpina]|uniref:Methyltransferase domain-containing protein n=1 Tax=Mortierella alpina TaxID=64518 RepID=A0A9P6JBX8_MORAP|nr:hypothetical protein BGZ70_001137 [Mortierella alpina]
MGANVSGDDFSANDREVFQSYRIPPKAYKKKTPKNKPSVDAPAPVSPTSTASSEFGHVSSANRHGDTRQRQLGQQHHQQQRLRAGSLSSSQGRPRRDRPISHPPSFLSSNSSTSSLNLSIVNAAVAAGSPSSMFYPYTGQISSAPLPMLVHGSSVAGGGSSIGSKSRTNSGYSIGSESFDMAHSIGSGLGRATYVNGKIVEMGVHGSSSLSSTIGSMPSFYTHNNYTVQDFMSYQQQQQQQFLEQQQLEYQQMLLLQQQQQQLKQQYQQQQLLLLQQQQQLQHQQQARGRSSQDLLSQPLPHPISGLVLQTKTRRPARHPDRVVNSSSGNGGNHQHRTTPHTITIPPQGSSLQRQPHSARTHFQNMLAMTSASLSSSSSSLHSTSGTEIAAVAHPQQQQQQQHQAIHPAAAAVSGGTGSVSRTVISKNGLSLDDLAAKILPPRRLLGGREYNPDKTLPYLLPCDEQEGERILLQHYVTRYAFGSNIIPPIDTTIAGKVLDCGCGPGTWVMEMATEYEDLEFYGFDISPMYPSAIHPKNAHFSIGNLLAPEIPFASDAFLLVHQRNMLLGLTQDAWPGVVQDLYRCVIPGGQGWLQLSEVDPIWSRPGPVSRSVLAMLNETAQNRNVDVMLPQRLDQVLKEVGCENVQMMMVEIPIGPWGGKIGVLWRDVLKAEMEAMKPVVLQAQLENAVARGQDIAVCGAEMTTSEEWEEMMAQVWAEMDQYHTFSRVYLAYGQKP